jgi:hypothetical protein
VAGMFWGSPVFLFFLFSERQFHQMQMFSQVSK